MVIFLRLPRLYQRNIYPGKLWLTHNNAKLTLDLIPLQREIDWIQQLDIYWCIVNSFMCVFKSIFVFLVDPDLQLKSADGALTSKPLGMYYDICFLFEIT